MREKIQKVITHKTVEEMEAVPEPEPVSKPKVVKKIGKKVVIVGPPIIHNPK